MPADCLFCKIGAGEIPATVVHETSRTIAFRDIDPKAPVHVLVIPKEHYETIGDLALADPQLAGEVCATAGKVAELEGVVKSGYRFMFNSGPDAGQEVFHVHGHLFAGRPLGPMLAR